jgi:hypothetical protein
MTEQEFQHEIDVLRAELTLMKQTIEECETKANAAYVRAEMASEHIATLMQRVNSLRVDVTAKITG